MPVFLYFGGMNFLDKLKKAATLEHAHEVEIAGEKLLIMPQDSIPLNEIVGKAEYFTEQELASDKARLSKTKLTRRERIDYKDQWLSIVGENGPKKDFSTEYDKRFFITHASWMSKLSIAYVIRKPDGSYIFSGNEELKNACDVLRGIPGLETEIRKAWAEIKKKRLAKRDKELSSQESN